jgi:hypothetical protein
MRKTFGLNIQKNNMEITTNENGIIELKKVYTPIKLITSDGEVVNICMRDSGFEINYTSPKSTGRKFVELKEGHIETKHLF